MIARLFLTHPRSVEESYVAHAGFALRFSFWLFVAAMAALVHAVFPFACERTASRITARLYTRTAGRGNPQG